MITSWDTITVLKVFFNKFSIAWTVTLDSPFVLNDINFEIYRSYSPESNFEKIGKVDGGGSGLYFLDESQEYRRNATRFYKVIAVEKADTTNTEESESRRLNDKPDGLLNTIVTRNELLLKNFAGEPCRILKHYKTGERCTKCWDSVKQQQIISECDVCYDTGWVAGYHEPIEAVQVHIDESPRVSNIKDTGEDQDKNVQAWMSNYPPMAPRDLIIPDSTKTVYRISRVDRTNKKNIAVFTKQYANTPVLSRQIMLLKEVDPSRIEYTPEIIKEALPAGVGFGNGGFGSGVYETTG